MRKTLSVGVIVGDNHHAGLATICSLINQTRKPDQIFILENPLKAKRLSVQFPHLFSLMAWAEQRGTECSLRSVSALNLVQARVACEERLTGDLLLLSDGDHFYPPDYLERACGYLADVEHGYYGCAVECLDSDTGLSALESTMALVTMTDDYVSGGSAVYTASLKGLYRKVLEYTTGLGDDRCWRALAKRDHNVSKGAYYPTAICHLATHSESKYPPSMSAKLIELCHTELGSC